MPLYCAPYCTVDIDVARYKYSISLHRDRDYTMSSCENRLQPEQRNCGWRPLVSRIFARNKTLFAMLTVFLIVLDGKKNNYKSRYCEVNFEIFTWNQVLRNLKIMELRKQDWKWRKTWIDLIVDNRIIFIVKIYLATYKPDN